MRRFLLALPAAVLAGGYAAWCLVIILSFLSLIITPLQNSTTFYATLIFTSTALDFCIFRVQIKKPAS